LRRLRSALGFAGALAGAALACASALPPATPETEPGRAIYAGKCHSCHRLYAPDRVPPEKWPALMEKMGEKAKLTPEEEQRALDYVLAAAPPR
jgi:mono/diheme cytochrome c family protein